MQYTPEEWRRAYQDDGFLIVQDVLDSALVSALRDGLDKITGWLASLPPRLREKIFLERDHVRNVTVHPVASNFGAGRPARCAAIASHR